MTFTVNLCILFHSRAILIIYTLENHSIITYIYQITTFISSLIFSRLNILLLQLVGSSQCYIIRNNERTHIGGQLLYLLLLILEGRLHWVSVATATYMIIWNDFIIFSFDDAIMGAASHDVGLLTIGFAFVYLFLTFSIGNYSLLEHKVSICRS